MKQLSIIVVLLLMLLPSVYAQSVRNLTQCDLRVTPICWEQNFGCGSYISGGPAVLPANGTIPAPGCPPPTITIGYEVCWDNAWCSPGPGNCVTLDAGTAATGCPAGSFPFENNFSDILPPCIDCSQSPAPKVTIDAAGNVTVGP